MQLHRPQEGTSSGECPGYRSRPKNLERPYSFCPESCPDCRLDYRGRDFEYIPFGAGRRIFPCLPPVVRMVHLMLASMILSFNWKLLQGINPNLFGTTLKKAICMLFPFSLLNLSYNNLIGQIPSSTQLQSLDSSKLCWQQPLCIQRSVLQNIENGIGENDNRFKADWVPVGHEIWSLECVLFFGD
ncbi:hypothetical protein QQP08_014262 [Theobroma cacao]|nr:hypothetical protein QQP08_014262 [Theobroma cacao]